MTGGYETQHTGWAMDSTPPGRRASSRRRWLALAVVLSVALAGAVLGQMSTIHDDASRPVPPGPFSPLP